MQVIHTDLFDLERAIFVHDGVRVAFVDKLKRAHVFEEPYETQPPMSGNASLDWFIHRVVKYTKGQLAFYVLLGG